MRSAALLAAVLAAGCARTASDATGPASVAAPTRRALAEGDRLSREGRDEEALVAYEGALATDRASVPAHLRYVAALLALGRREEARGRYEARAAQADATDAERTMAARLATDGASTPLRRVYTAAAERSPDVPWWRLAVAEIEIAEADAWNRRRLEAVARGDRGAERKALEQAQAALRRGDRALDRAAEIDPRLAETDLYRGTLRAVEGDLAAGATAKSAAYRAAEEAFARAARRDPTLVEAWEGLGDVRYRNGALREALEAWREAVARAPADARLRISLGLVLHQIGRTTEAEEQYLEAARLDPRDGDVWLRIGDARADGEKWDAALAAYAEALARDGRAIEAHRRSGRVLEHRGRWAEAREAYQRYVDEGGAEAAAVSRHLERLLRADGGR